MRARKILIALVVLLALILGGVAGSYAWYRFTHVKVDGVIYETATAEVDLRGQETTMESYQHLRKALPNAVIHWNVPFQDGHYAEDTEEISVSTLTEEDISRLDYLPRLSRVDATACRDYDALLALRAHRPDCRVDMQIHLGDQALAEDTRELTFAGDQVTVQALLEVLPYLPRLETITFRDPAMKAQELYDLQAAYPEITITWDKQVMGKTYPMDIQELDLSGTYPESAEAAEAAAAYFPELQKLIMVDCGIGNEEMAAFRERVRDQYQVIWGVQVGQAYLRTDDKGFIPSAHNQRVRNDDLNNLKYCEGLIAVDLGHIGVGNLSWVTGTPHLKYLIVGDADVRDRDVVHLSACQELEYLEIFMSPVTDISPLVECKALKDLNLSRSYVDVEPLGEMTWLRNLWMQGNRLKAWEIEFLEEKLPDTRKELTYWPTCHGKGWREMDSYRAMRDALGMYYMEG